MLFDFIGMYFKMVEMRRYLNNICFAERIRYCSMKRIAILTILVLTLAPYAHLTAQETETVHMANGIKIGEVSSTSAIVWTRLTKHAERNIKGTKFPGNVKSNSTKQLRKMKERMLQKYYNLDKMEGSVPGVMGEVHITYWPEKDKAQRKSTEWQPVEADKDFTLQIHLTELFPGTRYSLIAEGRQKGSEQVNSTVVGSFRTAPKAETPAPILFTVVSCQDYPRRDDQENGHKIYSVMKEMEDFDFFVHTGDMEYYDKPGPYADSIEFARFKWNRIYAMPYQRAFHNQVSSYFIKDDHDTLKNDCWPGQSYGDLSWEQGLELFREQVPMGDKTYRTIRWGKDLQIWLVEGRDFRSPNTIPDGPEKSIWGKEQKQWFFDTVRESDATFRILISPTPVVGPDRENKNDNHANEGFKHEGDELRDFIGKQKNMFVITGDRHWQYVSVDPATGVREYSSGPTTDTHAGGFKEKNRSPMHRYLKVKGGFLSVVVDRVDDVPRIVFRHHGIDGSIYNEDIINLDNEAEAKKFTGSRLHN